MDRKYLEFEKPLEDIARQIETLTHRKRNALEDTSPEIVQLRQRLAEKTTEIFANLTPWQKVQLARHLNRPHTLDYVERIFGDFLELHGDRIWADDPAIVAGIASFRGSPVAVVGQQKGRETRENVARKFAMAHPEGYRKAVRIMRLAEKLSLPVITLIDTPGAHPDLEAEERGQALAIAGNLQEMALLQTPVLSVIIGEGGSGGALGIAVGDRVLMQENAVYSVISPEGCASILWKSQQAVEDAARALKLTAQELQALGIIDDIVPEPAGGAHADWDKAAELLGAAIEKHLADLRQVAPPDIRGLRYEKYRKMGVFVEKEPVEP